MVSLIKKNLRVEETSREYVGISVIFAYNIIDGNNDIIYRGNVQLVANCWKYCVVKISSIIDYFLKNHNQSELYQIIEYIVHFIYNYGYPVPSIISWTNNAICDEQRILWEKIKPCVTRKLKKLENLKNSKI